MGRLSRLSQECIAESQRSFWAKEQNRRGGVRMKQLEGDSAAIAGSEGVLSQETQAAFRSWKRQGKRFFPSVFGRNSPADTQI